MQKGAEAGVAGHFSGVNCLLLPAWLPTESGKNKNPLLFRKSQAGERAAGARAAASFAIFASEDERLESGSARQVFWLSDHPETPAAFPQKSLCSGARPDISGQESRGSVPDYSGGPAMDFHHLPY